MPVEFPHSHDGNALKIWFHDDGSFQMSNFYGKGTGKRAILTKMIAAVRQGVLEMEEWDAIVKE
jgi:hypothetical protein